MDIKILSDDACSQVLQKIELGCVNIPTFAMDLKQTARPNIFIPSSSSKAFTTPYARNAAAETIHKLLNMYQDSIM